jgi:Flp pilus assembly protein TadD
LVGAWVIYQRSANDAPYVAGEETEGITRSLDRDLRASSSGFRFTDVTESAGIRFHHFPFRRTHQLPEDMGSGAAWGDYDGDGLPDLFLVNFAAPVGASDDELARSAATDRLFRNRGDGTFGDVTSSAGLGKPHRGMGAAWGDYDADGNLDLFVTSWGENLLWRNRGDGTFEDVTGSAGLGGEGFWAGATWSDFDLDGDLDLYVCGYVEYVPEDPDSPAPATGDPAFPFTLNPSSYSPHPNRLHVNRGDGTFEERAEAAGVLGESGRSLSAAWVDLDEDGWADLYVANDVSDNALYRSLGDGSFTNVSYEAIVADYRGAMGIAVGDWDGDLDFDIFITHWIAQENALYSSLFGDFADQEGWRLMFVDEADRVGLGQIAIDMIGWGTSFVDLDNDGLLDLFVANGSTFQERSDPDLLVPMPPHLYWNRGATEGFFEVGEEAGIRTDPPTVDRGAAFADYDADGDLDLVICRHGGPARLLRNDSRTGSHVSLRLRGESGHPSGRGARIVAHAGGRSHLRSAGGGPSYLSQDAPDVHVGLGDASRIDSLEVRWPGGRRDVWHDLEVGRSWILTEGGEARALDHFDRPGGPSSADDGPRGFEGRRVSDVSDRAIVADMSTTLSREETLRFWAMKRQVDPLVLDGRWEESIAILEEMTRIDPRHEDTRYALGNCHLELGQYSEALRSWRGLIEVNPAASRAFVQVGVLHTMPEAGEHFDLGAARDAFRRAHLLNKEESRPLILWGEAALASGDLEEAEEVLTAARRMNDQSTSALYLSGYIAWKRGDEARARELLERARRSGEGQKPAHGAVLEGDTKSPDMAAARRRAARRRLFSSCLEALRTASVEIEPSAVFAWVDEARASLPASNP